MRGVFITGTDTGVGKTVFTAGLLHWLRREGVDALPMKPIQTGCEPPMAAESGDATMLRVPDLEFALEICGLTPDERTMQAMCPYRFEPACSPHLAGELAGIEPEIARIAAAAERLALHTPPGPHALVVEGAGGLLVPINPRESMRDLAKALGLPVVIVARAGLGTINHTLLTLEALRAARLAPIGVVLNHADGGDPDADAFIREDNRKAIERIGGVPVLGMLPNLPGLHGSIAGIPEETWSLFAAELPGLPRILEAVRS